MHTAEVIHTRSELTNTPVIITVHERTALPTFDGAREEGKHLVQASIAGKPDITSLFERRQYIDEVAKNWHALREAGIPVAPDIYTSVEERFFVTDVKADGSETYGKQLLYALRENVERLHAKPERDETFLSLYTSRRRWRQVNERIEQYGELADIGHIALAADDPFEFIVHPDGSWDCIALDLANVITHRKFPCNRAELTARFKGNLSHIGELLLKPAPARPRRSKLHAG